MEPLTFLLTSLLILLPTIYYLVSFWRWLRIARVVNKLPGPKYVPLLGTVREVWGKREEMVDLQAKLNRRYGPLYRTWMGSFPVVHLQKAEHVEVIMKSTQNITKGQGVLFLKEWLGEGLLLGSGSLWHSRRKLITPAFHFSILEDFTKTFIEKADILSGILEEKSKEGEYIDIFLTVKLCGLDVICKTAMGIELNAMGNSNKKYVQSVEQISELLLQRSLSPWLHNGFVFRRSKLGKKFYETLEYLHEFTADVIRKKKQQHEENPREVLDGEKKRRKAFLDLLLEVRQNGEVLSDEALKNEVDTFMFAGHDTTTVATCWCLFLLGNYPDIQERVFEELDSIFQGEDRKLTTADVKDMKYLEMCIKEALRLYPSAPSISRNITHDVTIGGYNIPAGANVRMHIYQIHRDPEQYTHPDEFNPDNFLPENSSRRHPFAFVPFSAGLRNCIGQKFALLEEKVLLSTILRKFKVTSLHKQEEVKVYHEVILRPQNGIKIKLERR